MCCSSDVGPQGNLKAANCRHDPSLQTSAGFLMELEISSPEWVYGKGMVSSWHFFKFVNSNPVFAENTPLYIDRVIPRSSMHGSAIFCGMMCI